MSIFGVKLSNKSSILDHLQIERIRHIIEIFFVKDTDQIYMNMLYHGLTIDDVDYNNIHYIINNNDFGTFLETYIHEYISNTLSVYTQNNCYFVGFNINGWNISQLLTLMDTSKDFELLSTYFNLKVKPSVMLN
jgi:hypothetical protein